MRGTRYLAALGAAALVAVGLTSVAQADNPESTETPSGPLAQPLAGPTAEELRAKAENCGTQLSNGEYAHDDGDAATVPVCGKGGAVFWTADMDIDCDGQETEQCNASTDPWWQNDTAWHDSSDQPLNSAELPFVVVPLPSDIWDYSSAGIDGGTVVAVAYEDKIAYGVVGDKGPSGGIGEGSYELAEQLGIDPDPATGGTEGPVTYAFFPDAVADPIEDAEQARTKGEQAAAEWVNSPPGCDEAELDHEAYNKLENGASGAQVTAAQCLLRGAGFDPKTYEGDFDADTKQAVQDFQTDRGLRANGVVNPKTWTALLSAGSTPTIQNGSSGEPVLRLQRALTAALGSSVTIDGQFGDLTQQAVEEYQSSRDLDADGVVGGQTWEALQSGR